MTNNCNVHDKYCQKLSLSRYSMPFFVHARDEVALSKNYTAKSYLEERLKEIGLK